MEPGTSHYELYKNHDRFWMDYDYVYPVLSRRSRGISVGINLNPAGDCNFRCVYCQVDPAYTRKFSAIHLETLHQELRTCVAYAVSGRIFEDEVFRDVPPRLRRVNDVAFSGDGEPTLSPAFPQAVEIAADVRQKLMMHGYPDDMRRATEEMKLVLITNATRFRQPTVQRALETLMANNGEIWAKLDAGTEAYYEMIDRSRVPFSEILAGITDVAKQNPVVLQTLFCRMAGQGPSDAEIAAYCRRIQDILAAGGAIDHIQLHSVCRRTAVAACTGLEPPILNQIAAEIRETTGVTVEVY